MEKHATRRFVRSRRLSNPYCAFGLLLALIGILQAPAEAGDSESKLSEVVEEAKKPVEEQKAVDRKSKSVDNGGAWYLDWLAELCWDVGSATLSAGSGAPPASCSAFDAWNITLSSSHLRTSDGVLTSLTGGGLDIGMYLSSRVDAEASYHILWGRVDRESVAYGGVTAPIENAFALRARVYPSKDRALGFNGFFGLRYGLLRWDYRYPVLAIDEYGYGDEIWGDSIRQVSWLSGIGIIPLRTRFMAVGFDLGVGRRTYAGKTREGFSNDLFANSWYSQATIELTFWY